MFKKIIFIRLFKWQIDIDIKSPKVIDRFNEIDYLVQQDDYEDAKHRLNKLEQDLVKNGTPFPDPDITRFHTMIAFLED